MTVTIVTSTIAKLGVPDCRMGLNSEASREVNLVAKVKNTYSISLNSEDKISSLATVACRDPCRTDESKIRIVTCLEVAKRKKNNHTKARPAYQYLKNLQCISRQREAIAVNPYCADDSDLRRHKR